MRLKAKMETLDSFQLAGGRIPDTSWMTAKSLRRIGDAGEDFSGVDVDDGSSSGEGELTGEIPVLAAHRLPESMESFRFFGGEDSPAMSRTSLGDSSLGIFGMVTPGMGGMNLQFHVEHYHGLGRFIDPVLLSCYSDLFGAFFENSESVTARIVSEDISNRRIFVNSSSDRIEVYAKSSCSTDRGADICMAGRKLNNVDLNHAMTPTLFGSKVKGEKPCL